jgi:hypothetical protein
MKLRGWERRVKEDKEDERDGEREKKGNKNHRE